MRDWLASIDNWWLILAVLLAAAEVVVPGIYLFWVALGLAAVGLIHALFAPGWQIEMLLAAVAIPASLLIGHRIMRRSGGPGRPSLNRRGRRYVNRVFTLDAPLENRSGKLRIDDTIWKIRGERDLPSGERVRVVGSEGTVLLVEPEKGES